MTGVFLLRSSIKNYEWGKLGLQSTVAQLCKSSFKDFEVNHTTPYAELWMGTHPSGPAVIPSLNEIDLLQWIQKNPDSLGSNVQKEFGSNAGLPFLFKVLSVNKALSIQAHPDKLKAKELHEQFREHYPDENHKPEMAIALTEFEALCGFRTLIEIKSFVKDLPQLRDVIGCSAVSSLNSCDSDEKEIMKALFTSFMTCSEDLFKDKLMDLRGFFECEQSVPDSCKPLIGLFLRINNEYPGDIGCFSIFFLNYIILNPGEAIFLAANEPHAYLRGDCIECMACSDNVVRAGLTPKYKDVNTLCEILTYSCRSVKESIFPSVVDPNDSCVKIYDPPVREFTVAKLEIPVKEAVYKLLILDSASILIVIKGEAVAGFSKDNTQTIPLVPGSVLFISSGSCVELHVTSPILMFRAYTNI